MQSLPPTIANGTTICRSCGFEHSGRFCSRCGQRVHAGRFRLRTVAGEFLGSLLDVNRGWLYTVRSLLARPGETIGAYLSGGTVRYANPARFYLLGVTLLQLVALQAGMLDGVAAGFLEGAHNADADAERITGFLQRFFVALSVLALPIQVLSTKLVFRRARLTAAEHAVVHLYLTGLTFLVVAPFFLVVGAAHSLLGGWGGYGALAKVAEYGGAALAVGIYGRGLAGAFRERALSATLRTVAALVISFAGFVIILASLQSFLIR